MSQDVWEEKVCVNTNAIKTEIDHSLGKQTLRKVRAKE